MEYDNPAITNQLLVPPVLLEAAAKDPGVIHEVSRKHLLIALAQVNRRMKDPNVPVGQLLSYVETLSKISGAAASAAAAAGASVTDNTPKFAVNIIFSNKDKPTSAQATNVVDVKATEVVKELEDKIPQSVTVTPINSTADQTNHDR